MSKYSVIQDFDDAVCNQLCDSIVEVIDAVFEAIKGGGTATVTEIKPKPIELVPRELD